MGLQSRADVATVDYNPPQALRKVKATRGAQLLRPPLQIANQQRRRGLRRETLQRTRPLRQHVVAQNRHIERRAVMIAELPGVQIAEVPRRLGLRTDFVS